MASSARNNSHRLSERAAIISSVEPFRNWPAEAIDDVALHSDEEVLGPNENITRTTEDPNALPLIARGVVEVYVLAKNGKKFIFEIKEFPRFYGTVSLADGDPLYFEMITRSKTHVLWLKRRSIIEQIDRHPELMKYVAQEIGRRARRYAERLASLAMDDKLKRLAGFLLHSFTVSKSMTSQESAHEANMTQDQVADALGVSRQSASALIKRLVEDGIVEWRYGKVVVKDEATLLKIAGTGFSQ